MFIKQGVQVMSEQREVYPDRVFKEIPDNSEWLKQRKRKRIMIGVGILIFFIIVYIVVPPLNAYKESIPLKRVEKTAQVPFDEIGVDEWYFNQARLYVFSMHEEMEQFNYYFYSLVDDQSLFNDEEWRIFAGESYQAIEDMTKAMINLEPKSETYVMTNMLNGVLEEVSEINSIFKSSESGMSFVSKYRVLNLHIKAYNIYMDNIIRILEIEDYEFWLITK